MNNIWFYDSKNIHLVEPGAKNIHLLGGRYGITYYFLRNVIGQTVTAIVQVALVKGTLCTTCGTLGTGECLY